MNKPEYRKLHHASLVIADTETSVVYYCGLLGFEQAQRPDLPFAGAWLKVGDEQIHLLEVPNVDPVTGRPDHGGRDRHTAITVSSLEPIKAALQSAGIAFTTSRSGRAALFCRDPDGNALEFIEASM